MTTAQAMEYQDDMPLQLKKGSAHKMLKDGKKAQKRINREERTLGSMSLGGLVWYLGWHRVFWPNRTFIGWTLLIVSNGLWFWFKG